MKIESILKAVCSSTLAVALISSAALPAFASTKTSSQPYVESDTTVNFTLNQNKTYSYKMTVHGTHANPQIAAGNGNILRTESVTHTTANGNDVYYFKVRAIGKQGDATGVYTTLPNQNPVRHSDIAIPYNAGTYNVGIDIPAGQYVMTPTTKYQEGYYFTTNYDRSIISSGCVDCDSFMIRGYATVQNGDKFELDYATMIPAKDAGRLLPYKDDLYNPAEYKIGFDLPAGTYNLYYLDSKSHYEIRTSDSHLGYGNAVDSQDISGNTSVTVKDGQYLKLTHCALSPVK